MLEVHVPTHADAAHGPAGHESLIDGRLPLPPRATPHEARVARRQHWVSDSKAHRVDVSLLRELAEGSQILGAVESLVRVEAQHPPRLKARPSRIPRSREV